MKFSDACWPKLTFFQKKKHVNTTLNLELTLLHNTSKGLSRLQTKFLKNIATGVLNNFPSYHILPTSMSYFCSIL